MMSSNNRNLSADDQNELDEWLSAREIVLNHRTRRDLSDVVNMATLFKTVVPKLVKMQNYTSHGNLAAKLLNWETFNLNVLRKTGLMLMRPALEELASGHLASIRSLLHHLMRLERDGLPCLSARNRSPAKTHSQPDPTEFEAGKSPIDLLGAAQQESNEALKTKYKELKMVNETKAEFINLLNTKVQYLESVVVDKEKRISELLSHLSTLTMRIMSIHSTRSEERLNNIRQ